MADQIRLGDAGLVGPLDASRRKSQRARVPLEDVEQRRIAACRSGIDRHQLSKQRDRVHPHSLRIAARNAGSPGRKASPRRFPSTPVPPSAPPPPHKTAPPPPSPALPP